MSVANITIVMELLPVTERTNLRIGAMRYLLRLPAIFRWHEGTERTGAGFTFDVAVDGAIIQSSTRPPIGCEIYIEVLIPSPVVRRDYLHLKCSGKVSGWTESDGCSLFSITGLFEYDSLNQQSKRFLETEVLGSETIYLMAE